MSKVSLVTRFLALVAAIQLMAIFFIHAPERLKAVLEKFISDYQAILTSIGTLVLVGVLTIYATHLANISAMRRDRASRRVSSELKLSEFRQIWINELRNDISELISMLQSADVLSVDRMDRVSLLCTRILLRLNLKEDVNSELVNSITEILSLQSLERRPGQLADAITKLQQIASVCLKAEWDRLKRGLRLAQLDGVENA